jgi:hypothetical protein
LTCRYRLEREGDRLYTYGLIDITISGIAYSLERVEECGPIVIVRLA